VKRSEGMKEKKLNNIKYKEKKSLLDKDIYSKKICRLRDDLFLTQRMRKNIQAKTNMVKNN
jgi:hypothetical protein